MCRKITQTTLCQYIGKLGGIDRAATIEKFGHDPDTLSRGSSKKVVAVCKRCGKVRNAEKRGYRELCSSCAKKKYYEDHPNARKQASIITKKQFETPEEREKMRVVKKKYYEDPNARKQASVAARKHHKEHPETREKQSVLKKKYYENNPKAREKNSNAKKKYYEDHEARKRQGVAQKKRFEDPNARKQASVAATKYFENNPKAREKASLRMKNYFADPETREKHRALKKKYSKDHPEAREKMSVIKKKYYIDHPEAREKVSLRMKNYFADPEARKRQSAIKQGISYDDWEAFSIDKPYCPAFNETCRESNREKYGRRCFICNLPEAENKTKTGKVHKLSVHHVDLNRAQGCDGHEWKLVPTCIHHHGMVHTPTWIARITYLLREWDANIN